MRYSPLFERLLSAAKTKRYPFIDDVRGIPLESEFLGGGSWAGDDDHHTAAVEFNFRPSQSQSWERGGSLRDARALLRKTEEFLKNHPRIAPIEFAGREVEGTVSGTWILRFGRWNSTLGLNLASRPRRHFYAVLSMTESRGPKR